MSFKLFTIFLHIEYSSYGSRGYSLYFPKYGYPDDCYGRRCPPSFEVRKTCFAGILVFPRYHQFHICRPNESFAPSKLLHLHLVYWNNYKFLHFLVSVVRWCSDFVPTLFRLSETDLSIGLQSVNPSCSDCSDFLTNFFILWKLYIPIPTLCFGISISFFTL